MSPDPLARANAIEGLLPDEAAHGQAIKFGLVDPNEGVRFVAAVSLGDALYVWPGRGLGINTNFVILLPPAKRNIRVKLAAFSRTQ